MSTISEKPPSIRILTTGGTIDKVYFDKPGQFEVGEPQVREMLANAHVRLPYVIEEVLRLDSLQMQEVDRQQIRARVEAAPERCIVITHGTDTMAQTAEALGDIDGKVIVLTGAMQPARFHTSDATFNLGCAIGAVQVMAPGVYIAMQGRIFPAGMVRKVNGVFEWVG
jgi:L-asparaginase